MNNYRFLFFIFFILLIHFSCSFYLRKMYSIHSPKIKTQNSTLAYLQKHNATTDFLLIAKDTTDLNNTLNVLKSFPDAYFYNKDGYFLDYRETPTSCNAGVSVFIDGLKNASQQISDTTRTLNAMLLNKINLNTQSSFSTNDLPKADYYVLITWAEYMGKLNKEKSFDWLTHIHEANQQGITIVPILLNLDYYDFWGISQKDLPHFNYN